MPNMKNINSYRTHAAGGETSPAAMLSVVTMETGSGVFRECGTGSFDLNLPPSSFTKRFLDRVCCGCESSAESLKQ